MYLLLSMLFTIKVYECLYELYVPEYVGIDIREGIDIKKTNASIECKICQ